MKLLGTPENFSRNLRYSFSRYRVWWTILIVTIFFDIFSTYAFVEKYGIKAEGNLFTKLWMIHFGSTIGNIVGKLLQLVAVMFFAGLHRRLGNFFLLFIIVLNCWAIAINSMSLVF